MRIAGCQCSREGRNVSAGIRNRKNCWEERTLQQRQTAGQPQARLGLARPGHPDPDFRYGSQRTLELPEMPVPASARICGRPVRIQLASQRPSFIRMASHRRSYRYQHSSHGSDPRSRNDSRSCGDSYVSGCRRRRFVAWRALRAFAIILSLVFGRGALKHLPPLLLSTSFRHPISAGTALQTRKRRLLYLDLFFELRFTVG